MQIRDFISNKDEKKTGQSQWTILFTLFALSVFESFFL